MVIRSNLVGVLLVVHSFPDLCFGIGRIERDTTREGAEREANHLPPLHLVYTSRFLSANGSRKFMVFIFFHSDMTFEDGRTMYTCFRCVSAACVQIYV